MNASQQRTDVSDATLCVHSVQFEIKKISGRGLVQRSKRESL